MLVHTMITIEDLYPNLAEKELSEAKDRFDRYLALVLRIFERSEVETDPQAAPLAPPKVPVS